MPKIPTSLVVLGLSLLSLLPAGIAAAAEDGSPHLVPGGWLEMPFSRGPAAPSAAAASPAAEEPAAAAEAPKPAPARPAHSVHRVVHHAPASAPAAQSAPASDGKVHF